MQEAGSRSRPGTARMHHRERQPPPPGCSQPDIAGAGAPRRLVPRSTWRQARGWLYSSPTTHSRHVCASCEKTPRDVPSVEFTSAWPLGHETSLQMPESWSGTQMDPGTRPASDAPSQTAPAGGHLVQAWRLGSTMYSSPAVHGSQRWLAWLKTPSDVFTSW
eukprot:2836862-Rhodomonas_salina.4